MDPWNDTGGNTDSTDEANPTWSGRRESENEITDPKATSSPTFHASGPVDPWAENAAQVDFNLPSTSYSAQEKQSNEYENDHSQNSRNDFDPWGGGSVPMTTSTSAHNQVDLGKNIDDEKDEIDDDQRDSDWQRSNYEKELASKVKNEMQISNPDNQQQNTEPFDEDDPWGSGAQALRLKAEANAQRAEILRLQDEAQGKASAEQEEEEEHDENKEDDVEQDRKGDKAREKKNDNDPSSSTTTAPATTGGWRSFFTRSAAPADPNNTSRAPTTNKAEAEKSSTPRGSSEIKGAQRDNANAAPRLWQAPTLRTAHDRTGSNGTQGSGAKESGPASTISPSDQGPGWEVKSKKQTTTSTGFIQGILGSGQNKEGSALSRLGNPLQRPPVVSAQDMDEDDSGDVEDTGLEWDAGDSFENSSKIKQTKPPPDLLSNDIPQESAVSRLFGRFRSKAATEDDGKKQQEDDLSWLENIGDSKSNSRPQEPNIAPANEDDWLAFVEGNSHNNTSNVTQQAGNARQIPNAGEHFSIPNLAKFSSPKKPISPLGPPPRLGAPPTSAHTSRPIGSTQYPATTSPDPDETFGSFKDVPHATPNSGASYRDEPDSHDGMLLKGNVKEQQRRKANFLSSFTTGGRNVKPYTFDDDEEETRDNSWTAFRDVPYEDVDVKQSKGEIDSDLPPRSAVQSPKQPLQQSQQTQQTNPIMRSNSAGKSYQGGLLPPPPSNQRNTNTNSQPMPQSTIPSSSRTSTPIPNASNTTAAPQAKTLSQGKTLTNDDLSFFENL